MNININNGTYILPCVDSIDPAAVLRTTGFNLSRLFSGYISSRQYYEHGVLYSLDMNHSGAAVLYRKNLAATAQGLFGLGMFGL